MTNGLYTNAELIDTLIIDLNTLPKHLISGQYVAFCGLVNEMGQKLVNLKRGITNDTKNYEERISELKEQLRRFGIEIEDITPEELTIEPMGSQKAQEQAPGAPGDEMQA